MGRTTNRTTGQLMADGLFFLLASATGEQIGDIDIVTSNFNPLSPAVAFGGI